MLNQKHSYAVLWRKLYSFLALLPFTVLFSGCFLFGGHVNTPPPTQTCSFYLNNVFANCHNPLNSGNTLAYKASITTYWWSGSEKTILDQEYLTTQIGANVINNVIFAQTPSDNTTWSYDILITSSQCSTCAVYDNGYNDFCTQTTTTNGITAARPSLIAQGGPSPSPITSVIPHLIPNSNFGTCGCLVPFN